jgi:hypothetical protein
MVKNKWLVFCLFFLFGTGKAQDTLTIENNKMSVKAFSIDSNDSIKEIVLVFKFKKRFYHKRGNVWQLNRDLTILKGINTHNDKAYAELLDSPCAEVFINHRRIKNDFNSDSVVDIFTFKKPFSEKFEIHRDFYYKSIFGFERKNHVVIELKNNDILSLKFNNSRVENYKYNCEGYLKYSMSNELFIKGFEERRRKNN